MLLQLFFPLFFFLGTAFSSKFATVPTDDSPSKKYCELEDAELRNCSQFSVRLGRLDDESLEVKQSKFQKWQECMGAPKCELNQKILEKYNLKFEIYKRIASEYGPCYVALELFFRNSIPRCDYAPDISCDNLTPILCTVDAMANLKECNKKDIQALLDGVPIYVRSCKVEREVYEMLKAERENATLAN